LDYFLRNPAAIDSLTGIARWRLMEEFVQRSLETTQSALEWLVEAGYITEVTRLGSERMFQLNSNKREAAESFVGKPKTRKKPGE
jgi:hypothetical protein